ncbi:MAG TPA: 16S rRNA (cytosine(967)-C(5))-methyltransferase RsmB [Candidatus Limnocylindria bacterium]|jgi:16S rRNA (cytosine967-C5)-methyltransferase|nr:16S rRNA (cytosine(967)-C(5))-methyltransferase RsmB [Candidatus Limnocylindria bacterium]
MAVPDARDTALRLLLDREGRGRFIEQRFDTSPAFRALTPQDRGLTQELVYGVMRQQAAIDWVIRFKTDDRIPPPEVLEILRLGLYQILWLDRIPPHAAVNESVRLAREWGFDRQSGFINAILRAAVREMAPLKQQLERLKQHEPSTGYSHPEWLVERWQARYGAANTIKLLDWNNRPAPIYARVNTIKTTTAKLTEAWSREGVEFRPLSRDWIPDGLVFELVNPPSLNGLASFTSGQFYVQDPSTLLSVQMLQPKAGQRILDFCAAPGGKCTYIAQCVDNRSEIIAHDVDHVRLDFIRENATRLGTDSIRIVPPTDSPTILGDFDAVLLDAPCSNSGVLRRRVELRWRLLPGEMKRLTADQLVLIRQVAATVRPGGCLVYSTCSLEPEENSGLIQAFLKYEPRFSLEAERQLTPIQDGVDGAYAARLRRTAKV